MYINPAGSFDSSGNIAAENKPPGIACAKMVNNKVDIFQHFSTQRCCFYVENIRVVMATLALRM